MKHPQYSTASNKYASRASKPGKVNNSPEMEKELSDFHKRLKAIQDKIAKEKGMNEKLTKRSSVEKHIEDFKDSDAPQFKGKSQEKRRKMAVAAYLSKNSIDEEKSTPSEKEKEFLDKKLKDLMDKIKNDPKLLNVFKRLKDR